MITLTKSNDKVVLINNDLIELIELTPDTTVTLSTGRILVVRETPEEIIEKIVAYKRKLHHTLEGKLEE